MKISDFGTTPPASFERTAPFTLACGATITLTAWAFADTPAWIHDFGLVLRLTAGMVQAPEDHEDDARMVAMLQRVIRGSLQNPADERMISFADMADLFAAIRELNQLDEFLKKMLQQFVEMQSDLRSGEAS